MNYRQGSPPFPIVVVAFGGRIFGMSATNGQRVWTHEASVKTQDMSVRLHIENHRVYAMVLGELHILDYLTGRPLAVTKVPEAATHTFMVVGGMILTGGNGAVACFSLDGALLWSDGFKGLGYGQVALGVPGSTAQADLTS